MRSTTLLPLALTGVLVAVAGGAQTYDPPSGGDPGAPEQCAGAPNVVQLDSSSLTFNPPTIVVPAGQSVCWGWSGGHPHNIRANDGAFSSGPPTESGTFQRTFNQAGTYEYHCQTHGAAGSGMRGTVVVQADGSGDPGPQPGPGTFVPVGPVQVDEDAGVVTLTVNRTGGNEGKATLRWVVAGGTAKINKDFRKGKGTLSWPAGEGGPRTLSVAINNDGELEAAETFTVKFSKPSPRGSTLAASNVVVTIVDDDSSCATGSLAAPAGLRAAGQSPSEVHLSWQQEQAAATAVRVERARPGGEFLEIAAVSAGIHGFVDGGLEPGGVYLYRLRTEGADGFSTWSEVVAAATDGPTTPCAASRALCLQQGRFEATVEWRASEIPQPRAGRRVTLDSESTGLFSMLAGDEPELLLAVSDGCASNGHHWLSLAGVTEAELLVKVRDTLTGRTWAHFNPEGSSPALRDVEALDTCP
jgi:plastocyanin